MQTAIDIGTLIVQTAGVCGGRPRIAGTRVTVQNIAIDFNAGMKAEEIVSERLNLEKAGVKFTEVPARIVWFKDKLSPTAILEVLS